MTIYMVIDLRDARFFERGSTFNRMQYFHYSTFDKNLQLYSIYRTDLREIVAAGLQVTGAAQLAVPSAVLMV